MEVIFIAFGRDLTARWERSIITARSRRIGYETKLVIE